MAKGFFSGVGSAIGKVKGIGKFFASASFAAAFLKGTVVVFLISSVLYVPFDWIVERIHSINNPKTVYDDLEIENLYDLVEVKGDKNEGYYLGFKENVDDKLEKICEKYKKQNGLQDVKIDTLKKMMLAELVTQFPNLGGKVGNLQTSQVEGLGTKEAIPEQIREQMKNISLPEGAIVSYDDLLYLSIPYYDFNDVKQTGHLIVNDDLADEVLQIFKELYDIKYPIQNMKIIDNYYDGENVNNLDFLSIEDNNTSSFCYRQSSNGGSLSQHSFGNAIDINPQINPYVNADGSYAHINAAKFVSRNDAGLTEVERRALIKSDSDIYRIFEKYGWEWGGDWSGDKDYQHFVKKAGADIYQNTQQNTETGEQVDENEPDLMAFQGAVRVRRVTPNKNVKELKDTSGGSIVVTSDMKGSGSSAIQSYLSQSAAEGEWSVYAKNLATNEEKININDKRAQSASLIKVFIMATAYQEMEHGQSIDKTLIEKMITVSDNDATNQLIDQLGFDKIQKYIDDNGYTNTELKRKMLESSANGDNYTSVSDVAKILEQIYQEKCVSKSASQEMLSYLKRQTRTSKIPAGVPDGVTVANKTGELDSVENDAAIVFKENANYILVVMSSGLDDTEKARNNIKEISSKVYESIDKEQVDSTPDSITTNKHIVALDAGHGVQEHAGGYDNLAQTEADLSDPNKKWYTTGTSGKTPSGETWTEYETVQKVVDYVKQILASYSEIEVIQTGKDQPNLKRMQLAKDAGAEAYIGVHLNSDDSSSVNGTNMCIQQGAGNQESADFANIFLDTVSSSLGLTKGGIIKSNYTGLKTYSEAQIPSIYVEGAFMSSPKDMAVIGAENEEGLQKYAKGIANGILKYFDIQAIEGEGQIASQTETTASSINSKIFDMKYVTPEELDKMMAEEDENKAKEALNVFTLDENWNLVTVKWQYSDEQGLTFTKNTSVNYRQMLQQYSTPFEYLMNFYINVKDREFIEAFADLAIHSEYIMAVQDNVITVQETQITETWIERDGSTYDYHKTSSPSITESVQDAIEITYVDTWFVKVEKKSSYSTASISSANSNLSADQGNYLGDFYITVYCAGCNSPPGSLATASGNDATANHTIAVHLEDYLSSGPLSKGSQVIIDGQVYTVEDNGDANHIRPDKWIDIFIETDQGRCVCNTSSLNSQSTPVYVANNVREEQSSITQSNKTVLVNATAKVSGKVRHSKVEGEISFSREPANYTNNKGETVYQNKCTHITSLTETIANTYETGDSTVTGDERKFLQLFEDYPRALASLKPEWLLGNISINEKTSKLTDLTKYLLYKLLDEDFGKTEFDFSIYDLQSFSTSTMIMGNTPQEKVWFALRNLGYSEIVVAGAMGNIDYESGGFNPELVEKGSGEGIGLIQWSFGRRTQLEQYAISKGVSWQDLDTQIEFLVTEISGQGKAVGYATQRTSGYIRDEGITATNKDWENATSIEDATLAFMRFFESPGSRSSYSQRVTRAQKYYDEFKGKTLLAGDSRIGPITLTGENAQKMVQMLTDANRMADDDSYTYVYGAGRPADENTRQFDCSSFVSYLYQKHFGINLIAQTESIRSQAKSGGYEVSLSDLQPGDILYHYGHVAIYLGNNLDVEAMGRDYGIVVTNYNPNRFTEAYRFVR